MLSFDEKINLVEGLIAKLQNAPKIGVSGEGFAAYYLEKSLGYLHENKEEEALEALNKARQWMFI